MSEKSSSQSPQIGYRTNHDRKRKASLEKNTDKRLKEIRSNVALFKKKNLKNVLVPKRVPRSVRNLPKF